MYEVEKSSHIKDKCELITSHTNLFTLYDVSSNIKQFIH